MYFPYLYGRQAELSAVSDVAESLGTPQVVVPIIEPVKPAAKLNSTLADLKTTGAGAYVVINPTQGDLVTSGAAQQWHVDFAPSLSDKELVYPTFKESASSTISQVSEFVARFPNRKIGVALTTSKFPAPEIAGVLAGADYTVFFMPSVSATNYIVSLPVGRTVDVGDNFRAEVRNRDYSGTEWLANNHATWQSGGRRGFSDFTMLPGVFKDGGGPVGAVAVHLTYKKDAELWLQHFVSRTDAQTDPQATKFAEVLTDIHNQRLTTPMRFERSPGLKSYELQHATGNYTNLSGNKRQQISHHIYTVARSLTS